MSAVLTQVPNTGPKLALKYVVVPGLVGAGTAVAFHFAEDKLQEVVGDNHWYRHALVGAFGSLFTIVLIATF